MTCSSLWVHDDIEAQNAFVNASGATFSCPDCVSEGKQFYSPLLDFGLYSDCHAY